MTSPVLAGVSALLLLVLAIRGVRLYARTVWRWRRVTRGMPGPRAYPVIGSLLAVLERPNRIFVKLRALWHQLGDTMQVWIGPVLVVIVADPDDVETFCTNPALADKPWIYQVNRAVMGNGLFHLNNPEYHVHRKLVTSSMRLDVLKGFVQAFDEHGAELARRLRPLAESREVFDVAPYLGFCVNHSLCDTMLSTAMQGVEADRDEFVRVAFKASDVQMYRALRPWCWSDALFRLTSPRQYEDYVAVKHGVTKFVRKVLDTKVALLRDGRRPEAGRCAFLDHVLASDGRAQLTEAEIVDDLKALLLAGSVTSTEVLSFFFVCVSLLPDVQSKIHEELDDVFGADRSRSLVFDDLKHLQYLERCIKETLRLFPPGNAFARGVAEDVPLKGGHTLPKGAIVAVLPYFTHRNPKWFPDPDRFDPDRFLPENCVGRHPFAYVPYSAGSRSCVAQRYALMTLKTHAASVLRHYSVHPDPGGPKTVEDINLKAGITLVPDGGARISLRARPLPAEA